MKHYRTMGIDPNATPEEIKSAYRTKAKELHPDKGGDEEKFKELNEAYSVLSDPQKKAMYDLSIGSTSHYSRSLDIYQTYTVEMKDVYFGATKRINKGGKIVDLEIPRGIQNGTTIVLHGKGETDGKRVGDMFIKIYIQQENEYKQISPLDLEVSAKISLDDMLHRKPYKVKLWDTEICTVIIPEKFNSASVLRVKGHGLYHTMFKTTGDLYLKFVVEYPVIKDEVQ